MIINGKLSLSQQETGKKKILLFSFLNGIALTCITGNILSLYLLRIGCTDSVVAIISSFGYLATLFAFIGKGAIAKLGASATLRSAWIVCGIAAISLSLIPMVFYLDKSKPLIMLLITLITFIFYVFKAIGTASTQPLMGEYTTNENQGSFSSKYFLVYTIAQIITMGLVFLLMFFDKKIFIFQLIIFLGAIIEFVCSSIFITIKETNVPRNSAKNLKTKKLLSYILKEKVYRDFLIVKSVVRACLILIVPISILALKYYGVSDSTAVLYAFIQLGGGIIITYINGIISEETGPKPLLIIYVILMLIICVLWVFSPIRFEWGYCAVIFFVGGICLLGLDANLNHYYLALIPREASVGVSLWFTVIGGAVAGISGLLIGGGLIHLLSDIAPPHHLFRFYYAIMFFLTIPIFIFIYKLKPVTNSNWKVSSVLGLVFDPQGMHNLYVMQKINKYDSLMNEWKNVRKLEGMKSDSSQDSLLYYLESPRHLIKLTALRSFNELNLTDKAKKAILDELEYGEFSTAHLAAIILAKNKFKEAIPFLRKYLKSEDSELRATSLLGLVMLNDTESYPEIIDIFKNERNPRITIYGSLALSYIKDDKILPILLNKFVQLLCASNMTADNAISQKNKKIDIPTPDINKDKCFTPVLCKSRKAVNDEILCCIAQMLKIGDLFYEFLRIVSTDIQLGVMKIYESFDENKIKNLSPKPDKILTNYYKGKINTDKIIEFMITYIDNLAPTPDISAINNYLKSTTNASINIKMICLIFILLFCKYEKKSNSEKQDPKLDHFKIINQ